MKILKNKKIKMKIRKIFRAKVKVVQNNTNNHKLLSPSNNKIKNK